MEVRKNRGLQITQIILAFMMVGIFVFFILGQMLLPAENYRKEGDCRIWETDWVQLKKDGSSRSVEVPGYCQAQPGEWVTIATTLPQEQEDTSICVRSMQQELKIYVGDQLREEYSTLDTQLFGKTSTMTYVFAHIGDEDAGKQVRIEFATDSSYAGYVSDIYIGEKSSIWRYFISINAPSAMVAAVMLLISLVVILVCFLMRLFNKREAEISYLGMAVLIASAWLLVESKIRQFIFPNSTIAMQMGFLLIMILPYPFSAYINKVQKGRYWKAYIIVSIAAAVNFAFATLMQVFEIKDFFETMSLSHIIIVSLIVFMGLTIGLDIKRGFIKEYKEVAIGFCVLMFSGVIEILLAYKNSAHYNGITLCLALVVLLFAAVLKSVREQLALEKEKQIAIAAGESKTKFLASMSHEIRTPINSIIGMNEMILRENENDEIDEYAREIKSSSQMLLALINDVLDFSKIQAGKLTIVEENYYVAPMLRSVIYGIENRATNKGLEMKLQIDKNLPTALLGDEIRIKQIFNNLLSNAVKYTEKGSVTLIVRGVRREEQFALFISVADTGIGIRQEDMAQLFDSFQRLELKKNRAVEGTGLGLNITKQLVDDMSGKIEVSSEYGKGSRFNVVIPQIVVDETPMGSLDEGENGAESALDMNKKKDSLEKILHAPNAKVLVVDDMKANLKVVEKLLKRTEIQLDFATSGQECIEMTKVKKYDIILMDHMMPEPDGIETLHIIRADKQNANWETTVIVLTANAIAGMEEEYLKEGFADYLSKPIEARKLEETLAKYLETEDIHG